MDLILTNLAPNRTASIQLYQRGTNTIVGSPIVGTSSGYEYTFANLPFGDFEYALFGFTTQSASRKALRVTESAVYTANNWWEIDTAISNGLPVAPSLIAGLCNVVFAFSLNGESVPNAVVSATLEAQNNSVNQILLSRSITLGETDENGLCTLTLVQHAQFTRGGTYRIRVTDKKGVVHHDRLVTIPNTASANAEDLPDATDV